MRKSQIIKKIKEFDFDKIGEPHFCLIITNKTSRWVATPGLDLKLLSKLIKHIAKQLKK